MYDGKAKKRKEKYFKKVYDNAPLVKCACGCGTIIKSKDKYGRDKKYISGHNGRKYKDPTQYKREWSRRNRESLYRNKVRYGHKRKVQLIKLKGGKCMLCGIKYNGSNASMFDFHHRIPKEKKFNLGMTDLLNRGIDKVLEEVKKCDLLCSNCHRLLHSSKY